TVAELKSKGGESLMAEATLAQLEGLGLIVPRGQGAEAAPAPVEPPADTAALEAKPEANPIPEVEPPIASTPSPASQTTAKAPPAPTRPSLYSRLAKDWRQRKERRQVAREQAAVERAFAEEDAVEEAMAEALLAPKARVSSQEESGPPPRRAVRGGHPLQLLGILTLGLALAALLGLLLYPYGMYRAAMERRLSAALGDSVSIGDVGVSFAPLPYITLHRVSVGAEPYATAATVRVLPELGSLFEEHKILREVRVAGLDLRDQAVVPMGKWFPADRAGGLTIRRLALEDVSWTLGALAGQGWRGDGEFGSRGELTALHLQDADGKHRADLTPGQWGLQVHLAFTNWQPPFAGPLTFSSLAADGLANARGVRFSKIDVAVSDGRLEGTGGLLWMGGAALSADLSFRHVELSGLLEALGSAGIVTGPANGTLKLLTHGAGADTLFSQSLATGTFEASPGTLRHLGLVESLQGASRAGSTRFEKLTGEFAIGPTGTKLERLKLTSGALRASGRLELSAKGDLGGRLEVELRSSGSVQRASLPVGGTAADPTLGARR
ncbi:MAG TPA: AsmA-like C-terminal region-containing protein, partial [Rhodocyclaceae bacterium]|nr:AsmA-like C-terminal region-containing protein [Rhodocyclaceae bacterium]